MVNRYLLQDHNERKEMKYMLWLIMMIFVTCVYGGDILIGTNIVEIVFDDEAVSEENRNIIIDDIKHVFSVDLDHLQVVQYTESDEYSQEWYGYLSLGSGKGHNWPRPFWTNNFGYIRISKNNSKLELPVPQGLLDEYLKAIEIKKTHANAFIALDVFLQQVNEGFNPDDMTFAEKKAVFWFPPNELQWSEEKTYDKNLRSWQAAEFILQSLLSFKTADVDGQSVFYCKCHIRSKITGTYNQALHSFMFDGANWRISSF